jgi:hypothetical protein
VGVAIRRAPFTKPATRSWVGLALEVDVGESLPVIVADNEAALVVFLDILSHRGQLHYRALIGDASARSRPGEPRLSGCGVARLIEIAGNE